MVSLPYLLSEEASAAFAEAGLDPSFGTVTPSDRPDLGQFQCNGALPAAKIAKKPPREIAQAVLEALAKRDAGRERPFFAKLDLAGPGFINMTLTDETLAERAGAMAAADRFGMGEVGAGKTVLVDFGGPNIAKPMHVGHLRSTIIGDSLQRILRFTGHGTTSDVHMGDWGLPMGMLISEIAERQPDLPYFVEGATGPFPEDSPVSMEDLEELYPAASKACKADEARAARAREATAQLQKGHPGYRALWRHFMDVSIAGMRREFGALGVVFDLWKGEADVDHLVPDLVEDLKARQIAEESEGALIVPVAREDDKSEVPPLILLKSDGSALYGTTDVATIIDRAKAIDPDLVLYVVDQRQHLHFEQVFRAADKAGVTGKAVLEHIGFGTMNGPDGKPFKTRAGGVLKLYDLITMAQERAAARLDEAGLASDYPPDERAEIARKVGIAAIKFADLSNYRLSNYIFDLERFTSFEGKTGPYLQYAAVRIKSILRRAEVDRAALKTEALPVNSDAERGLALALTGFPAAIEATLERRAPNMLCDYLFGLAQDFSRFYAEHHILSGNDPDVRTGRLALCAATLDLLETGLDLLGIEVPERM